MYDVEMARLPRYFLKDVPLHLIQRGNNREPIFASDEDCQFYKDILLDAADRHQLSIHAYVLMTNHVHLLASPATEESVPKTLQSVGRRYCQIRPCLLHLINQMFVALTKFYVQFQPGGEGCYLDSAIQLYHGRCDFGCFILRTVS